MDVVDDAPLFLEGALDWLGVRGGFLESLTKFFVGLLKAVPMAAVVAAGITDDEAEGCGHDHPYGYEVGWVFSHATFSDGAVPFSWMTRWTVAREIP